MSLVFDQTRSTDISQDKFKKIKFILFIFLNQTPNLRPSYVGFAQTVCICCKNSTQEQLPMHHLWLIQRVQAVCVCEWMAVFLLAQWREMWEMWWAFKWYASANTFWKQTLSTTVAVVQLDPGCWSPATPQSAYGRICLFVQYLARKACYSIPDINPVGWRGSKGG